MTTNGDRGLGGRTEGEQWSEETFAEALSQLNHLQDQLNTLRYTLPGMVSQFSVNHSSPDDLYNAFEQSATATMTALEQLKSQWNSGKTQEALDHARKSRESSGDYSVAGLSRHHDPPIKNEASDENT